MGCPWQYKRHPIVLSKEEKEYIDKNDKSSNSKSYDEHITYGTTDKKYHYICPRYWCIRDDNGKGRSLTWKQINKGDCGGWDALIPNDAKRVPKGKRIFEFTDDRFHKENIKTKNPLVYKPMYPSFQSPDKHPDGLCVPCCFTSPRTYGFDNVWGKKKELSKDVYYNKITNEKKNNPPIKELNTYKGKPLPTFEKDSNGNIIESTIKGVKYKRSLPAPDRINAFDTCNESIEKDKSIKNTKKIITTFDEKPLTESFPLKPGKIGYLPISLQKFLNYKSHTICKNVGNNKLKENKNCLMRVGVENDKNQSFLGAIANIYHSIKSNEESSMKKLNKKINLTIQKLKTIMLKNISLDKFVSVNNGNLVNIFFKKQKKISKTKYSNQNIYKNNKSDKIFLNKIINSYENFLNYLSDDKIKIDYEFLWDFICEPIDKNGLLFEEGVNLIILNSPNDDITNKIELICPTNNNSNNIFDIIKPTIILYSRDNFYEPLCQINKNKKKYKIKKYFLFESLNREIPEIYNVIFKIKKKLMSGCKEKNSVLEYDYEENIYLKELLNLLIKMNYTDFVQVINYDTQVIAVMTKKDNDVVYLPCKPSGILNDLEFKMISDDIYVNDYDKTIELLNDIYIKSDKKIKSNPKINLVYNNMVVGIITITNQIIPINPEIYDNINKNNLITIKSNDYLWNDNKLLINDKRDYDRVLSVKKIKLESNFYSMFRNIFKIIINENDKLDEKNDILDILKNIAIDYITKLKTILNKIKLIMQTHVEFIKYKLDDLSSIDELILCLGLNENDCNNSSGCGFLKKDNICKLLIPEYNLLSNDILNSKLYYEKLADELIRYGKIREYIFSTKKFLSFERMNYNLNEDEIILLEDLLLNKYFEELIVDYNNSYVNMNVSYDKINPIKHIPYQNIFNLEDKKSINIKIKNIELSNKCDVEEKTINFNGWLNYHLNNEDYSIKEYNGTGICSFYLMKDIISNKLNKNITIYEIKKKLIELIMNEINKGWTTKITMGKIFRAVGKKSISKDILIVNWENIIMNETYYLTEYEIYLLCREYKINLIGLVSKGNKLKLPISNKNNFSTIQDNKDIYIIIIKNYKNVNKAYSYGLVTKNNSINLNPNNLNILVDFVGNIQSIDEYYKTFLSYYDKKEKEKKSDRAKYMKKWRLKGKIKKKKQLP